MNLHIQKKSSQNSHFFKKTSSHQPVQNNFQNTNHQNPAHESIQDFIRTGLFSLTFVLLMTAAVYLLQNTITVTSSPNGKELPIYCVDRDDNKIAISFDAAWAEYCLMEH